MVVASCSSEGKLCCYPLLKHFTQMFANGVAKLKTDPLILTTHVADNQLLQSERAV